MTIRRYDTEQRKQILMAQLERDIPARVTLALQEDLGQSTDYHYDITGQLLSSDQQVTARIITRENGVFCGQQWLIEVFRQLGRKYLD